MTAIYFHPEAYSVESDRVMGRNSAGDSFLRGLFQHSSAPALWASVGVPDHAAAWSQFAANAGWQGQLGSFAQTDLAALARVGGVFYPGPGLGDHARQRALVSSAAWSVCGITHTLSSARVMDAITQMVSAPIAPWDALICTSQVARAAVTHLLETQEAALTERLGANRFVRPLLPVIPLGVHAADFMPLPEQRAIGRARLGLADDELAVLFMGRLSFHAKAHPLAMYLALEQAAQATGRKIVLVECGWYGNDYIAQAFAQAAQFACPSVRRVALHANKAEERRQIWAAADVFCSLSDNIQETFGLTPIEAMAAGLPVVVSDWDGYKDTVRDGIDGFRIPTIMPRAGLSDDLAIRHALEIDTYDMYIGHTCSLTAVDIAAATAAFTALFASADLRRKMGAAGQARARDIYDWRYIIPQYQALWAAQDEHRRHAAQGVQGVKGWPARPDPFAIFDTYPTQLLTENTVLIARDGDIATLCEQVAQIAALSMVKFAHLVLPTAQEVQTIMQNAVTGPQSAAALVQDIPLARRAHALRALGWLIKIGVLSPVPAPPLATPA